MKFRDVISAVEGAVAAGAGNPEIRRVCEDSRKAEPGDLFVARSGTKVSGAQFARDAVAKGAVAVVGEEAMELEGVAYARVGNANLALARMAHQIMGNPARAVKTLAVTGTNGKTTVTYLIRSILQAAGGRCGLIGTVQMDDGARVVESEMTTPGPLEMAGLMARMRDNGVGYCVMETSSHALNQDRVAGIDFAVAMFTNLTGDHLDYHGTMDAYAAAKALLFSGLGKEGVAVINGDDAWAEKMTGGCGGKVVTYGIKGRHDWTAEVVSMTSEGMELKVRGPGGEAFGLRSPLVGEYNVYNTLCAIGAVKALGVSTAAIVEGLERMAGAPGRLEPVLAEGMTREELPFQVLVDYAHTHDALENVLLALRPLTRGKLICVFGCGGDRDRTKRPRMAAVAEKLADRVVLTSDNPRTEEPGAILAEVAAGFSAAGRWKVTVEADRRAAIGEAIGMAEEGDVVVIAGKGHENYQIIGKTKHHFDDVEEARAAMAARHCGGGTVRAEGQAT